MKRGKVRDVKPKGEGGGPHVLRESVSHEGDNRMAGADQLYDGTETACQRDLYNTLLLEDLDAKWEGKLTGALVHAYGTNTFHAEDSSSSRKNLALG